jgi:hypothetical protein
MKKDTHTTEPEDVKSKILSRIQQQLNRELGAEGPSYIRDVFYDKGVQYLKGPVPVQPDSE